MQEDDQKKVLLNKIFKNNFHDDLFSFNFAFKRAHLDKNLKEKRDIYADLMQWGDCCDFNLTKYFVLNTFENRKTRSLGDIPDFYVTSYLNNTFPEGFVSYFSVQYRGSSTLLLCKKQVPMGLLQEVATMDRVKDAFQLCSQTIIEMKNFDVTVIERFKVFFKNLSPYRGHTDLIGQCLDAFTQFYQDAQQDSIQILQRIARENPDIVFPFLLNIGCYLAAHSQFDLAFAVLLPIKKEKGHSNIILALADLLFREGEAYLLSQGPNLDAGEARKIKYQSILVLLQELDKNVLFSHRDCFFLLEQSIKGLLSKNYNVLEEWGSTIETLLQIDGVNIFNCLWMLDELKEIATIIIKCCQEANIEHENLLLLKSLHSKEEKYFEYYLLFVVVLKNLLSVESIQQICSPHPLIKSFRSNPVLPFNLLIEGDKSNILKMLDCTGDLVESTTVNYKLYQQKHVSTNVFDPEIAFKKFAQIGITKLTSPLFSSDNRFLFSFNTTPTEYSTPIDHHNKLGMLENHSI